MLPKINRLRKKKEIDRVFAKGKGLREDYLSLRAAQNGLDSTRFCFIVSHRVSKDAVGRNKIKRRLREISRSLMSRLKTGYDIVIISSPGLKDRDFWEIKDNLETLFSRAGLTKAKTA